MALDLVESGTQEKNRLQMATSKFVQRSINSPAQAAGQGHRQGRERDQGAHQRPGPELKLDAELLDAEKGSAGSPPSVC
ncbi:MAG: hypothetical protein U1F26_08825 [Lysobacterales bacterium]